MRRLKLLSGGGGALVLAMALTMSAGLAGTACSASTDADEGFDESSHAQKSDEARSYEIVICHIVTPTKDIYGKGVKDSDGSLVELKMVKDMQTFLFCHKVRVSFDGKNLDMQHVETTIANGGGFGTVLLGENRPGHRDYVYPFVRMSNDGKPQGFPYMEVNIRMYQSGYGQEDRELRFTYEFKPTHNKDEVRLPIGTEHGLGKNVHLELGWGSISHFGVVQGLPNEKGDPVGIGQSIKVKRKDNGDLDIQNGASKEGTVGTKAIGLDIRGVDQDIGKKMEAELEAEQRRLERERAKVEEELKKLEEEAKQLPPVPTTPPKPPTMGGMMTTAPDGGAR